MPMGYQDQVDIAQFGQILEIFRSFGIFGYEWIDKNGFTGFSGDLESGLSESLQFC